MCIKTRLIRKEAFGLNDNWIRLKSWSVRRKSGLAEAVNRPKLAFAVSPKYLFNETNIYIFITGIRRVFYRSFFGFVKNFIFPTSGRHPLLRAAPRNYQLDEEMVKKWPGLKLSQNKALWALVRKSLVDVRSSE